MAHENAPILLACDFDGTIWFTANPQPWLDEDARAATSFRRAGNLLGVCTGRTLDGIRVPLAMMPDDVRFRFDFMILLNGSRILGADGQTLFERLLPRQTVLDLHERFCCGRTYVNDLRNVAAGEWGNQTDEVHCIIQANDTAYTFEKPFSTQTHVDSMDQIPGDMLRGISFLFGTVEAAQDAAAWINGNVGDVACAYVNRSYIDVVPAGCSKGRALEVVRELFGAGTVAAIGDSYNDLPMLDAADVSFALAHAPEDVRGAADHVVEKTAYALEALTQGE